MLKVAFDPVFRKNIFKIKDKSTKERLIKQVSKLKENPETGKPMRYGWVGTREIYVCPFRISYSYNKKRNLLIFLDLYHKDDQ